MKKFHQTLRDSLKQIVGKECSLSGPSNCITVTLLGGKEYFGLVKEIGSDYFIISVSYTGGGKERIAVSLKTVTSFSLN